jgi:hypothetical protein
VFVLGTGHLSLALDEDGLAIGLDLRVAGRLHHRRLFAASP